MPRYNSENHLPLLKRLSLGMLITGLLIFCCSLLFLEISTVPAVYVIPLFGGMWYEHNRRGTRWDMIFVFVVAAGFIGLLLSMMGKQVTYVRVLERWPWAFTICFGFFSGIMSGRKYTQRLTEGLTMLQSVALIYLITVKGFFTGSNALLKLLGVIWLAFAIFSIFQGLTHFNLNRRVRFILSIWSSFIMLLFSGIYVYDILSADFGVATNAVVITKAGLSFFLLGYSSLHMAHNWFMLFGFLPWSTRGFNKTHRKGMKELAKLHIARYNREQVPVPYAWFVLVVCALVFTVNYFFRLLPAMAVIWLLFWLLPYAVNYLQKKPLPVK